MNDAAILPLIETQFLAALVGVLYTAVSGLPNMMVLVNSIVLANQDTVGRSVTLYKVPSGGAPATSNQILSAMQVPGNSTFVMAYEEGFLVIPVGGMIQGFADVANKVTITMGGKRFQ